MRSKGGSSKGSVLGCMNGLSAIAEVLAVFAVLGPARARAGKVAARIARYTRLMVVPLGSSPRTSWLGHGQGAMVSFAPLRCATVCPGVLSGAACCARFALVHRTRMSIPPEQGVSTHSPLKEAAGDIIDSSSEGEPLAYLHGHGNLVPGLERELTGKDAGDKMSVKISPAHGHGELPKA